MADLFDTINFLEIQNAKSGNRNEARLRDLEGKAAYLAKKTGSEPVSWYEFTREVPENSPNYLGNIVKGALVGAAVLGGVGFLLAPAAAVAGSVAYGVGSGVLFGGLWGGYTQTQNTSRQKQVDAYEQYLTQFEQSQSHGLGLKRDGVMQEFNRIANSESKFASQVQAQREAQKNDCGCKGH